MRIDSRIERCAQICDDMVRELGAQRDKSRKGQYDRKSPREIDFAMRAVARVGERIRTLKPKGEELSPPTADAEMAARAITIITEMRPLIAGMRGSAWKQEMLARIDELKPPEERSEQ